jgi:hypothetical protein
VDFQENALLVNGYPLKGYCPDHGIGFMGRPTLLFQVGTYGRVSDIFLSQLCNIDWLG